MSYLCLGGGLATVAAAVYLAITAHMRLPFLDMWPVVNFFAFRPMPWLRWLWLQHNEHRILIPKLLLLIDYQWFGGRDIFASSMNLVAQSLLLILLLWVFRFWEGLDGAVWRTAASMAALTAFCTCQWFNFISGFQVAFTSVGLMTVAAVVFLLSSRHNCRSQKISEWRQVSLAVAAGVAATYSAANGILVWPILLFTAILQRSRKAIVGLVVLSGILTSASYLYHYVRPPRHASPLSSIRHPYLILEYVAKYVGSPLDWGYRNMTWVFGTVGIVAAIVSIGVIVFRSERKPLLLLLASIFLFVLGSAVMTSLGRLNFGADQALSSRYETIALLLWLALGLLLLIAVRRIPAAVVLVQVLLLLVMFLSARRLQYALDSARGMALAPNTASLALLTGVYDRAELGLIYPAPEFLWKDIPYLKQHHLSVFETPLASNLGKPLQSVYRVRSQGCWGAVDQVTPIPTGGQDGLRVRGWTWDRYRRHSIDQIIFVANGNIVGYAESGYRRVDVRNYVAARSAKYAGWTGYVEPLAGAPDVAVYATVNWLGTQVCQVDHPSLTAPSSPIGFSANSGNK